MNSFRTPWSDEVSLIYQKKDRDPEGFERPEEVAQTFICSWTDGVGQGEFYRSMKAGMQASASFEMVTVEYFDFWPPGYTVPRFAEFRGRRYQIVRTYPSGFDTLTVILTEVIR